MKDATGEQLMDAIRQVLSGTMYVSKKISSLVMEAFSNGSSA
jgi:DNA-binding NarL/FixJ family response regulator